MTWRQKLHHPRRNIRRLAAKVLATTRRLQEELKDPETQEPSLFHEIEHEPYWINM